MSNLDVQKNNAMEFNTKFQRYAPLFPRQLK